MSFDLGPVKRPMIQESQNMQNNGGGGNLGYMAQGDEEETENTNEEENTHLLDKNDDVDVVDINIKEEEEDFDEILKIDFNLKEWFVKIIGKLINKNKKD